MSVFSRTITLTIVLITLSLTCGCIRSLMIITSEPPDAMVTVDKIKRGRTPVEVPFAWYWHHDIVLEAEGFETMKVDEYLKAPPWFIYPLDGILELMPFPITDTHNLHYDLQPEQEGEVDIFETP